MEQLSSGFSQWEAQFKIGKLRPTDTWNNLPHVTRHGEAWLRPMTSRLGQWTLCKSTSKQWWADPTGPGRVSCGRKFKQKLEFVFSPLLSLSCSVRSKCLNSMCRKRTQLVKLLILSLLRHPQQGPKVSKTRYLLNLILCHAAIYFWNFFLVG